MAAAIQCPHCRTVHPVDVAPPAGTLFRCNACGGAFATVGSAAASGPAPAPAPLPVPKPAPAQSNYTLPRIPKESSSGKNARRDTIEPWRIAMLVCVLGGLFLGGLIGIPAAIRRIGSARQAVSQNLGTLPNLPTRGSSSPSGPYGNSPFPGTVGPIDSKPKEVTIVPAGVPLSSVNPPPNDFQPAAVSPMSPVSEEPASSDVSSSEEKPAPAKRKRPQITYNAKVASLKEIDLDSEYKYQWHDRDKYRYLFDMQFSAGGKNFQRSGYVEYEQGEIGSDVQAGGQATGTAFVVHSDGLLMTCAHCVKGAQRITVHLGEEKHTARVVAIDKLRDLAILRVQTGGLTPLPLADSDKARLGETVYAFGFPLSDRLGRSLKMTTGSVSGIVDDGETQVLQSDVNINPGNSGGPLLNDRGEVVAVNSAGLFGTGIQEVSFGVPSNFSVDLLATIGIEPNAASAGEKLSAPDLAEKVGPSVAFIEVQLDSVNLQHLKFKGAVIEQEGGAPEITGLSDGHLVSTSTGDVTILKKDVSLGLFLRSMGTMVFEQLPTRGETEWVERNEVQLGSSASKFGESVGATARETVSYQLQSSTSSQLLISKKVEYARVGQPTAEEDKLTGTGNWIFNKELGVPDRLEMEFTVSVPSPDGKLEKLTGKVRYTRSGAPNRPDWQAAIEERVGTIPAGSEVGSISDADLPEVPDLPPLALDDVPDDEIADAIRKVKARRRSVTELQDALGILAKAKPIEKRRKEAGEALLSITTVLPSEAVSLWIQAVRVWGNEKHVAPLVKIISGSLQATPERTEAIEALGYLPVTASSTDVLVKLVRDRSARLSAMRALHGQGSAAESAIASLLNDRDREVRLIACLLLTKVGTQASIPFLERHVKWEGDKVVEQVATTTLGVLRSRAKAK